VSKAEVTIEKGNGVLRAYHRCSAMPVGNSVYCSYVYAWNVNRYCGWVVEQEYEDCDTCFVVDEIRYCPFCGKELEEMPGELLAYLKEKDSTIPHD